MGKKKSSSTQKSVEQGEASRKNRKSSWLLGIVATLAIGTCLFGSIWGVTDIVRRDKEVPPLDMEKMQRIVGFFVTLNVALVGLIPVAINNLRGRIERSNVVENRKKARIYGGIIDGFCPSVFVWSVILFAVDVVWFMTPCAVFFWAIFSLEIAMLIVYLLFFLVTTQSDWPKTYLKNIQESEGQSRG